jgi:hypothetical protein
MNCEIANVELVECARGHSLPDHALESHLGTCESCRERWEAERELTSHLRVMRIASVPASIEWSKAVLMRDFDANRRRERQVHWMWAMSSAAVLVLSVIAMRDVWVRPASPALSSGSATVQTHEYAPREYTPEPFGPAEEAGEKGFSKLPFALPPVPGETYEILRAQQLGPADLARMGVAVDPGWTGTLQADIVVGEDGLAQAVRLSNDGTEEN